MSNLNRSITNNRIDGGADKTKPTWLRKGLRPRWIHCWVLPDFKEGLTLRLLKLVHKTRKEPYQTFAQIPNPDREPKKIFRRTLRNQIQKQQKKDHLPWSSQYYFKGSCMMVQCRHINKCYKLNKRTPKLQWLSG